jgi:hypothetical protein
MRLRGGLILAAVFFPWPSGCAPSSNSNSASSRDAAADGPPRATPECDQLASFICTKILACSPDAGETQASCLSRVERADGGLSCETATAVTDLASCYDAIAAAQCPTVVQGTAFSMPLLCTGVVSHDDGGAGATSATVAPGGACIQDNDCILAAGDDGAFCALSFAADSGPGGTCVQLRPGTAGDSPCVEDIQANGQAIQSWSGDTAPSTGYSCAQTDGLRCDTVKDACAPLLPTGQSCGNDGDCVITDHCDQTSLTCASGSSTGTPCTSAQACATGSCANGLCG